MYAIIDSENRVIGKWEGNVHIVPVYEKKREAKADLVAMCIPGLQIVDAANAMHLKQSKFSK